MKRKIKLFATLTSLCLAVALMAFGVYAATQVTWTVSSQVSFTSQRHVRFDGYVDGGKLEAAAKQEGVIVNPEANETDQNKKTWNIQEGTAIEFGTGEGQDVVTYIFVITNLAADPAKVTVAEGAKLFGDENLEVKMYSTTGAFSTIANAEGEANVAGTTVNFTGITFPGEANVTAITSFTAASLATNNYIALKVEVKIKSLSKSLEGGDKDKLNIVFNVDAVA